MKNTLRWLGALALCIGIVAIAQPAYAASSASSCSTGLFQSQCKTGSVAANSSGHWVDVYIDLMPFDGVSWRVVDDGNGNTVGSGNLRLNC